VLSLHVSLRQIYIRDKLHKQYFTIKARQKNFKDDNFFRVFITSLHRAIKF